MYTMMMKAEKSWRCVVTQHPRGVLRLLKIERGLHATVATAINSAARQEGVGGGKKGEKERAWDRTVG